MLCIIFHERDMIKDLVLFLQEEMRKKDNSFGHLEGYNPMLQMFKNAYWVSHS